jgi:hypothetical protein
MALKHPLRAFLKDNSLSLVLFGLFLAFLIGLALTGWHHSNEELTGHQRPAESLGSYLGSGAFAEAVFENWESEFLQMGALVVLTIFLYQKGSADSKKLRGSEAVDTKPRRLTVKTWLYENSLSLALFGLFALTFALHAISGTSAYNQEAQLHHQATVSVPAYVTSSQFWFESFQNWQSEFLAVGALLILSIFLRQRGSPESKPITEPNTKTGG